MNTVQVYIPTPFRKLTGNRSYIEGERQSVSTTYFSISNWPIREWAT